MNTREKSQILFYNKPAGDWNEALPVGNGRLGAMVYGKTDVERIQINEDTIWSGGPHNYANELQAPLTKNNIDDCLVELKASKFAWGDMKVSFWNDTCIHFVERSTGGMIIAYDVGSIFIMRPTEFIVKISNSIMKMDSTGFTIGADKIRMQSSDVGLGENPVNYIVVTSGAAGGENSTVSETVRA